MDAQAAQANSRYLSILMRFTKRALSNRGYPILYMRGLGYRDINVKKIQVFIEHDIVIRHFLHNNTFFELEKCFDVQYVFPIYPKRVKSDIDSLGLRSVVRIPVDGARLAKLRNLAKIQTISIAHKNHSYKFVKRQWRTLCSSKAYLRMLILSMPIVFSLFKKKVIRESGSYPEMEKAIDDFEPDIILHPSVLEGVFISDLALLTGKKKLPFVGNRLRHP